mmetsp:Transcript_11285/g.32211  ORF Transcript_11285/g.32211 Transcript_11285/m.32211 type:complete len:133 (+) Transcript_11285:1038-1436(+)
MLWRGTCAWGCGQGPAGELMKSDRRTTVDCGAAKAGTANCGNGMAGAAHWKRRGNIGMDASSPTVDGVGRATSSPIGVFMSTAGVHADARKGEGNSGKTPDVRSQSRLFFGAKLEGTVAGGLATLTVRAGVA